MDCSLPTVDIENEDWLYRRLSLGNGIKKSGTASSAVFRRFDEPEQEPSVDLAKLTTPQESVDRAGSPGFRLSRMQAKEPRTIPGFDVVHSPRCDNPAHGHITGENTHERCRLLANMLEVLDYYSAGTPGFSAPTA